DVIDEACAVARLLASTPPSEIYELEKQLEDTVMQKEQAIRGQQYEPAARLRDKEKELRARCNDLKKSWKASRPTVGADVTAIEEAVARKTGVELERIRTREPLAAVPGFSEQPTSDYERRWVQAVLPGVSVEIVPGTGFVLLPHTP